MLPPILLTVLSLAFADEPDDLSDLLDQSISLLSSHHVHARGEVMVGYHVGQTTMGPNRQGTRSMSSEQVLAQGYDVAPLGMRMVMHRLDVMAGVSNRVTVMVMVHGMAHAMDHVTADGRAFTSRAGGPGDAMAMGHLTVIEAGEHAILLVPGLSVPTGSVSQLDDAHMGQPHQLPYPMQLGLGTLAGHGGISYVGSKKDTYWGADASALVPVGWSAHDYRWGNRYVAGAWAQRHFGNLFAGTFNLKGTRQDAIVGEDPSLGKGVAPTADPNTRAGERLEAGAVGSVTLRPGGAFHLLDFYVDGSVPVWQRLDGPQLGMRFAIGGGVRAAWGVR